MKFLRFLLIILLIGRSNTNADEPVMCKLAREVEVSRRLILEWNIRGDPAPNLRVTPDDPQWVDFTLGELQRRAKSFLKSKGISHTEETTLCRVICERVRTQIGPFWYYHVELFDPARILNPSPSQVPLSMSGMHTGPPATISVYFFADGTPIPLTIIPWSPEPIPETRKSERKKSK